MGASESSRGRGDSVVGPERSFLPEERARLEAILGSLVDARGRISEERLQEALKAKLPSRMISQLHHYMRGLCVVSGTHGGHKDSSKGGRGVSPDPTREQFILCMAHLLKGDAEQLSAVVLSLAGLSSQSACIAHIRQFLSAVLCFYSESLRGTDAYRSWRFAPDYARDCFIAHLLTQLDNKGDPVSGGDLEKWFNQAPQLTQIIRTAFNQCFPITDPQPSLLPCCTPPPASSPSSPPLTLLDPWGALLLAGALPPQQEGRGTWRPLYDSRSQGESFATLLRGLLGAAGPSIIIVRDKEGAMFGGYAAEPWALQPRFYGSAHCFLFTLAPSVAVYTASGYNNNFLYLNLNQQTLPNGLGMGGQLGHYGLWLDADFSAGHSQAACSTFTSPQLSSTPSFLIDVVEVWGVGPGIQTTDSNQNDEESSEKKKKKGVLNMDAETRALMEMIDRGQHSAAIREEDARLDSN